VSGGGDRGRKWRARALGLATALLAMAGAWSLIRWPAPGISLALGLGVYWLARAPRADDGRS
jgi:hypothetical protein